MSYYDNVKDNVKDKGDSGKPNFDTLRQAAEEHSEEEEEKTGDGTEIEVLEEGGLRKQSSGQKQQQRQRPQQNQQPQQVGQQRSPQAANAQQNTGVSQSSGDMGGVEEKLDKIIEQNQKMIEILDSFGS